MSRVWWMSALWLWSVILVTVLVVQTIGMSFGKSSVIAYKSWAGSDLYLVDLEYGIRLVIISAAVHDTASYSLSADGRWLACVLEDGERDIYVMNLETGDTQNFTNNHSFAYFYNPIMWSPDGRWLAFVSNLDGDTEIYVLSFPDGELRQLTHNEIDDDVPAWSSDSQFVAYMEDPLGETSRLRFVDVETGTIQSLISDDILNLTWSHDGQWIAYTDWVETNLDVLAVNVITGESINVTNNSSWDGSPIWSPTGNWLAFESDRHGDREVYIFNIVTNELLNLTPDPVSDSFPRWSSDGRWLWFQSAYIGMRAMNIETGELRTLPYP